MYPGWYTQVVYASLRVYTGWCIPRVVYAGYMPPYHTQGGICRVYASLPPYHPGYTRLPASRIPYVTARHRGSRARRRARDGLLGSSPRNSLGERHFLRSERKKCDASYVFRAQSIPALGSRD